MKPLIRILIILFICCATSSLISQNPYGPIHVDVMAPNVTYSSPVNGVFMVGDIVNVTWSATDENILPYGISIGIFDIDNNHFFILKSSTANDGSESITLSQSVVNGKIRVIARDAFGNAGIGESSGNISVLGGFVLSGYVYDIETNEPLGGATISASMQRNGYTAYTNENGYYELENLSPGQYTVTAMYTDYTPVSKSIVINSSQSQSFYLAEINEISSLSLNSDLTLYADNITEVSSQTFEATGNVNINGILAFTGLVTVKMQSNLEYPHLIGTGQYSALDIQGANIPIKSSNQFWDFRCEENELIPDGFSLMNMLDAPLGGYNLTLGNLIIDPSGEYLSYGFIVDMSENFIQKIMDYYKKIPGNDYDSFCDTFGGSLIFNRQTGLEWSLGISGVNMILGFIGIKELSLYYNSNEDILGGGLTIRIPAIGDLSSKDIIDFEGIPVCFVNDNGILFKNLI